MTHASEAHDPVTMTVSLKEHVRPGTEAAALHLLEEHDYWLRYRPTPSVRHDRRRHPLPR
ncbi:hypothetical protein GCM10010341_91170 [Streptomyces noursei]|nr:hypothetical protein GCM10010341_91170 [Streptomyces noursei]